MSIANSTTCYEREKLVDAFAVAVPRLRNQPAIPTDPARAQLVLFKAGSAPRLLLGAISRDGQRAVFRGPAVPVAEATRAQAKRDKRLAFAAQAFVVGRTTFVEPLLGRASFRVGRAVATPPTGRLHLALQARNATADVAKGARAFPVSKEERARGPVGFLGGAPRIFAEARTALGIGGARQAVAPLGDANVVPAAELEPGASGVILARHALAKVACNKSVCNRWKVSSAGRGESSQKR
jgi:hypothetical protein